MKTHKKMAGFGVVEIILIVVLIGLLGFVGWYVYQANQSKPDTSQKNTDGQTAATLGPKDFIKSYALPAGWIEKPCQEGHIAVIPTQTTDPNCAANQPDVTVSVFVGDNSLLIDPTSCEITKPVASPQYDGYDCKNVEIDGKKGIRQTYKYTDANVIYGKAEVVEYVFSADPKNAQSELLSLFYMNVASRNQPDFTNDFDAFVKSVKFQ